MAGSSSATGQRVTTWMKVTLALLVVYVLTLVIEVPIGFHMLIEQDGTPPRFGRPRRSSLDRSEVPSKRFLWC